MISQFPPSFNPPFNENIMVIVVCTPDNENIYLAGVYPDDSSGNTNTMQMIQYNAVSGEMVVNVTYPVDGMSAVASAVATESYIYFSGFGTDSESYFFYVDTTTYGITQVTVNEGMADQTAFSVFMATAPANVGTVYGVLAENSTVSSTNANYGMSFPAGSTGPVTLYQYGTLFNTANIALNPMSGSSGMNQMAVSWSGTYLACVTVDAPSSILVVDTATSVTTEIATTYYEVSMATTSDDTCCFCVAWLYQCYFTIDLTSSPPVITNTVNIDDQLFTMAASPDGNYMFIVGTQAIYVVEVANPTSVYFTVSTGNNWNQGPHILIIPGTGTVNYTAILTGFGDNNVMQIDITFPS